MAHGRDIPAALIVAGPTCSGKSALALALAEQVGGTIINADSMQVYRELKVITARPSEDEERRAPHRLYGIRQCAEPANAAWWREAAVAAMVEASGRGALPILCGGTGLYLSTLTQGIADVPAISTDARAEARRLLAEQGAPAMHAALADVDPATAARLKPNDSQRIARAWEVWRDTGRGLAAWQSAAPPTPEWSFSVILLRPPRETLRAAIEARVVAMLQAGAIAEVQALAALALDPALPAMRAHGVPELAAHLRGEITLAEAVRRMALVTAQYAKRQETWFRHRMITAPERTHMIYARIADLAQFSETEWASLVNFTKSIG